jgi:hypothetical protein
MLHIVFLRDEYERFLTVLQKPTMFYYILLNAFTKLP